MSRRVLRIFKVRESGNAEFWLSNLFIMASTIIGVYLAAQAGFTTAMQFEIARSDRDGYYMRRALLDEVKDNLASVDEWSAVRKGYAQPHFGRVFPAVRHLGGLLVRQRRLVEPDIAPDELKMKTFVWETMKQQTITFQLAPQLLPASAATTTAWTGT